MYGRREYPFSCLFWHLIVFRGNDTNAGVSQDDLKGCKCLASSIDQYTSEWPDWDTQLEPLLAQLPIEPVPIEPVSVPPTANCDQNKDNMQKTEEFYMQRHVLYIVRDIRNRNTDNVSSQNHGASLLKHGRPQSIMEWFVWRLIFVHVSGTMDYPR